MPKDFEGIVNDYSYTQNRELSWLRFNRRVLEEAADDLVPPLERLKFISIFSSNLDEFFMVRVGSLLDLSLVSPDEIDNKSGLDPAEQLQAIYEAIPSLLEIKGQLYSRVSTLLAQAGVQDLTYDDLTAEEQAQVDDDFRAVVLPVLSPQIVGQRHPSPRLTTRRCISRPCCGARAARRRWALSPARRPCRRSSRCRKAAGGSCGWRRFCATGRRPFSKNTRWRSFASSAPPATPT